MEFEVDNELCQVEIIQKSSEILMKKLFSQFQLLKEFLKFTVNTYQYVNNCIYSIFHFNYCFLNYF